MIFTSASAIVYTSVASFGKVERLEFAPLDPKLSMVITIIFKY